VFGQPGTVHEVSSSHFSADIEIDDVQLEASRAQKTTNFILLKLKIMDMNVSVKIYHSRYVQLFGFKDTAVEAENAALFVVGFLTSLINDGVTPPFDPPTGVTVMAISAFHVGVSELGMCFDLDVLERALRATAATQPNMTIRRNTRNHSLILRLGEKCGSQLFHGTGTLQLMGIREPPASFLAATKALLERHPDALLGSTKKRKKRHNMLTGASFPTPTTNAPMESAPCKRARPASPCEHASPAEATLHDLLNMDNDAQLNDLVDQLVDHVGLSIPLPAPPLSQSPIDLLELM